MLLYIRNNKRALVVVALSELIYLWLDKQFGSVTAGIFIIAFALGICMAFAIVVDHKNHKVGQ